MQETEDSGGESEQSERSARRPELEPTPDRAGTGGISSDSKHRSFSEKTMGASPPTPRRSSWSGWSDNDSGEWGSKGENWSWKTGY